MAYMVDRDEVIEIVRRVILANMSVEDQLTAQDKVLLGINKSICEAVKAIDPQEITEIQYPTDGRVGDWWVPQITPKD